MIVYDKKNGMASGWACLLANSKKCTGGIFGDTFKKIYDSIDVLIGGGPLILDKSTGYA